MLSGILFLFLGMDLISTYFYTLKKIIFSQNFITPVILTFPLEQRHGSRLLLGITAIRSSFYTLKPFLLNFTQQQKRISFQLFPDHKTAFKPFPQGHYQYKTSSCNIIQIVKPNSIWEINLNIRSYYVIVYYHIQILLNSLFHSY